jgi:hypothetical protein
MFDARVLQTTRIELTSLQINMVDKPSYFQTILEIDHIGDIPIFTRFQPLPCGTILRLHKALPFTMAQPRVSNGGQGWLPGNPFMESKVHQWSTFQPS